MKLYSTRERPDPAGGRDDTRMAVTNDMSETTVARQALARDRAGRQDGVRKTSLGLSIALLVQYALGMWVNVYVTVPKRDQGGGVPAAVGRALSSGPAALALHAGIGLVIVIGSVALVARAIQARHRMTIVTSLISLLAVAGAAVSGATFVNTGSDGASLGMALLTAVALLCLLVNLYALQPSPQPPTTQGTS
jgi:hypothetical protein